MMTDLDNLKTINDTYGHDWGDIYLRKTAHSLQQGVPSGTVVARLSGDEFLLLFYGYETKEAVRKDIRKLEEGFARSSATLPDGKKLCIRMSGGVAWYPDDAADLDTLKRYADFAMYEVKHSTKGQMKDFDIGVYNQEAYIARTRREFHQLISEERMYYYFQPIFSAQTGRVHAYEALMRSDLPTLRSPATIMKLAREQGALYEIERLTFRKALEGFDNLRSKNLVDRQALIFINSIASVCLRREDSEYMDSRWHELRRQMVIEITEEEEIDREALAAGEIRGQKIDRRVQYFLGLGDLEAGETFKITHNYGVPWPGPKFWCPDIEQNYDSNNYRIFRYADAILMMAECYCNLENAEETMRYLNMVRQRAGVDPVTNFTGFEDLTLAVRCERARELGGEFQRKFDLVRWGIWYTKTLESADYETVRNAILPCHEYYPIPDKEVVYSGGALDNKAYNEYGM